MIDGNLLFSLELCPLALLVGVGIWRVDRTRQSATINASARWRMTCAKTGNSRASRPILDDACGEVTRRGCSIWCRAVDE
jgi:hypothetical protein